MKNTDNKRVSSDIRKMIHSEIQQIRIEMSGQKMTRNQEEMILDYINSIPDGQLINLFTAEKLSVMSKYSIFINTNANKRACHYIFWRIYWQLFDDKKQ
jgi:hypothetical protein